MRLVLPVLLVACATDPVPTAIHDGPTDDVTAPGVERDLRADVDQDEAYGTPPQCYARTQTSTGGVHNGCYTCHGASRKPNYLASPELQAEYAFPTPALENRWTNLFVDRSVAAGAHADDAILSWVRADNYHADDGTLALQATLADVPAGWDADGDGTWSGFVPDAWLSFDARGFDLAPDGTPTGWRTYAWHPRPGLFMPTNGAMTDALIRLPQVFREDDHGAADLDAYALNLAILEAAIKRSDVAIPRTDETAWGVDLDRDGALGDATHIAWDWAPREDRHMSWVGAARLADEAGTIQPPTAGLFPVGTEFFHTLRYLDVVDGRVTMGRRMKEVRYLRKRAWRTWGELEDASLVEAKEDFAYPDRVPPIVGDVEHGVRLSNGWNMAGFIEDARGELRPQTRPELAFCTGCHSGTSSTDDAVFTFGRKLDPARASAHGWYHWQDQPFRVADWTRPDGHGAYATYLREARAGDPFRANDEVLRRFFEEDGTPKEDAIHALAEDATPLLLPSPERALMLDKVYRVLVSEQSFDKGRDPLPRLGQEQVWERVEEGQRTGILRVVE